MKLNNVAIAVRLRSGNQRPRQMAGEVLCLDVGGSRAGDQKTAIGVGFVGDVRKAGNPNAGVSRTGSAC